jgi:hypothetical protein
MEMCYKCKIHTIFGRYEKRMQNVSLIKFHVDCILE